MLAILRKLCYNSRVSEEDQRLNGHEKSDPGRMRDDMATVLVTGGCGRIGEKVCSGLLKKHNIVIAVDKQPSDYNAGKENYFFRAAAPNEKGKYGSIFDEFETIDYVVHLACSVDNDLGPIVDKAQIDESAACDAFLYKLAISKDIKKFMLLSTTQIYQQPESREPVQEGDGEKPLTNYAKLKSASEHAFAKDVRGVKTMINCIMRVPPVYMLDFTDNLMSRLTDPKNKSLFVLSTGEYGFHMCCIHNLSDFIICFLRQADEPIYTGIYNVADAQLVMVSEIISFMKENHRLGPVMQRTKSGGSIFKKLFGDSEFKTNYRYLDMDTVDKNFMFDITKAQRLCPFRWHITNTK